MPSKLIIRVRKIGLCGHGRGRGRVPRGVLRARTEKPEARDVEREAAAPGSLIDSPFPRAPRTVLTSARFVDGITSV